VYAPQFSEQAITAATKGEAFINKGKTPKYSNSIWTNSGVPRKKSMYADAMENKIRFFDNLNNPVIKPNSIPKITDMVVIWRVSRAPSIK
jgi:hypothetical protein